jgi:hypothetical protein
MDKVDPRRRKDLMLKSEPQNRKSKTESAEPILLTPYTLIAEPSREKERRASELPIYTKSNTAIEEPRVVTP